MKKITTENIGKINGISVFAIGVSEEKNVVRKREIYINWSYDLVQGKPNFEAAVELNSIFKMTQISSIELNQKKIAKLSE